MTLQELREKNPGWRIERYVGGIRCAKGAWRVLAEDLEDAQYEIYKREPERRPKSEAQPAEPVASGPHP